MRIIFIVAVLIIGSNCCAQRTSIKNDFLFNRITTKEGLSINETTCTFQDSKGFIWIGTTDGLNLYTGNNMVIFRNDPKDSLSLPDNAIRGIAEDKNQNLWIISSRGITRMNLSTRKIEKIYIGSFAVLLIDSQDRIWTADFGVNLYDPKCDCFQSFTNHFYTDERQFRMSNMVASLFEDSNGRMWVGTRNGIYQFDLSTEIFSKPFQLFTDPTTKKKHNSPDATVTQILEDHNHQLWLATWGSGLIKFFPEKKEFTSLRVTNPVTKERSVYEIVNEIAESRSNNEKFHFWCATDLGFAEYDEKSNNFFVHQLKPRDIHQSYNVGIRQIYADRSGIIWISTESEGVYILDPYRQVFKTNFFSPDMINPAHTFGEVNYILSEADTIWVATWYGHALYKLDKNLNLLKKWEHVPPQDINDESNRGNHIFRDKRGFIWISTLSGLHRLDTKKNIFKSFKNNPRDSTSLPNDRVVKFYEDSEGICWVCFYKGGICKYDPRTEKFYEFLKGPKSKEGQYFYFNVWDVIEDQNNNVWFADDGLGLWKYDRLKKKLNRPLLKEIPEGHINSLFKDARNNIWVATRSGLAKISGDSVIRITVADGLPSNNIYSVQEDNQNRLWILTNQGLARYEGANKVRVFKEEDGLEKLNLEGVAFQKLSDGRLAIGASHYITLFDPNKISLNEIKPPIHLTQFKVLGEPMDWENTKEGKHVTLHYTQNQFSFDFAVLNYSNPAGNKFYYQMIGFDPNWIRSSQGFANYTNLDPGDYVFRVKGANADGVINETGDSILITIVPPIWRTWWFILLYILAISGIIYTLYRIRLNQLLRLEKLRAKISTDLHDDMGSTLSSISILSNMALKSDESSKHAMLTEIKDSSITLMERMDDIVWSINPKNDSLDRLMSRVGNFASRLFEAKGIDYQIEVPSAISNIRFSMEDRQHIYLIMKEAVNNLVKYAECTNASIKVSTNPLVVEISDNGKGFDPKIAVQGNGLPSMRNRAKLLNADLIIQTGFGQGTSVVLRMKIK